MTSRATGSGRSLALSATLIGATIAAGLAIRLVPVGLPPVVVKYGGSMLWALMIYWIVSTILPRSPLRHCAILAGAIATAVEVFKLYRTPWLDAFRQTLPGALLLGRTFTIADLIAYALAIGSGMVLDHLIRTAANPRSA